MLVNKIKKQISSKNDLKQKNNIIETQDYVKNNLITL